MTANLGGSFILLRDFLRGLELVLYFLGSAWSTKERFREMPPTSEHEIRQRTKDLCDYAGASPKEVDSLYQQLLDSFREYRRVSSNSSEIER